MHGPLLIGSLAVALWSTVQPQDGGLHARPSLISETDAAVPGQPLMIALSFEIDKGWHLYWQGHNDTGLPPSVDLKLPEGWKAEPVQWPAPTRSVYPGEILDHTYEGTLTLIVPVRVPESATGQVSFEVSSSWLVCERTCVPEKSTVNLTLPVRAKANPTPSAPKFAAARSRHATPLRDSHGVRATVAEGRFRIEAKQASRLVFYPGTECAPFLDLIKAGDTQSGVLSLTLGDSPSGAKVSGIVEVRKPDSPPAFYSIDIPVPQDPK